MSRIAGRCRVSLVLGFVALTTRVAPSLGQTVQGAIEGNVMDSVTHAPLPGALITARDGAGAIVGTATRAMSRGRQHLTRHRLAIRDMAAPDEPIRA